MEVDMEPQPPSLVDKMARQMKKHPLIPAGMLATAGALTIAFKRMQQRDSIGYQRWLRARVLAQALTIVAIVVAGVQEMGMGVLTGNARPATPPPTPAFESREFEKRLKEAEVVHRVEASVKSTGAGAGAESAPTWSAASVNTVSNFGAGARPSDLAPSASLPSSQPNSSSWSSWLGWSKKD